MAKGKYQEWLKPNKLKDLEKLSSKGLTDEEIFKYIGIGKTTFYKWIDNYEDFRNAIKKGRNNAVKKAEEALVDKFGWVCKEEEIEEVTIDYQGRTTKHKKKTKKWYPPDTSAIIFYLKCKGNYIENPEYNNANIEFKKAETKKINTQIEAMTGHGSQTEDLESIFNEIHKKAILIENGQL